MRIVTCQLPAVMFNSWWMALRCLSSGLMWLPGLSPAHTSRCTGAGDGWGKPDIAPGNGTSEAPPNGTIIPSAVPGDGIEIDEIHMSATIRACGKAIAWPIALELLDTANSLMVQKD